MKIVIATVQPNFEFPLNEAVRKQVFLMAKKIVTKGYEVNLVVLTLNQTKEYFDNGIKINLVSKKEILKHKRLFRDIDKIIFINVPGIMPIFIFMLSNASKKSLVVSDGGVFSIGKYQNVRRLISKFLYYLVDEVFVYTEYQKNILISQNKNYIKKIKFLTPILDRNIPRNYHIRENNMRMLYMGHLSEFKGIDVVLYIFKELIKNIPNLKLVIANNGILNNPKIEKKIKKLKIEYCENLILKGTVDPYEELSKADLYIYPFKFESGTFAFPLSLYESLLTNTPFLSSKLEVTKEFFNDFFLCPPDDKECFLKKASDILLKKISQEYINKIINNNLKKIWERLEKGSELPL